MLGGKSETDLVCRILFFSGLSIHLATVLLAHMFSYDMTWGATSKVWAFLVHPSIPSFPPIHTSACRSVVALSPHYVCPSAGSRTGQLLDRGPAHLEALQACVLHMLRFHRRHGRPLAPGRNVPVADPRHVLDYYPPPSVSAFRLLIPSAISDTPGSFAGSSRAATCYSRCVLAATIYTPST